MLFPVTLFAGVLCSGTVKAKEDPVRIVKVGIFPIEPLNFIGNDGKAQGFNTDLVRETARLSKTWEPEFFLVTWADGLEKLQNGSIDLMVSVSYSVERAKTMEYSQEPVMEVWGQVYIRPDSGIVSSLDLDGTTVGVMSKDSNGRNFMRLMRLLGVYCEIVEYETHADVFDAIASRRIAAGVAPNHYGMRNAQKYGLRGTSIQFSPSPIFFASKKGQLKEVLDDLDERLAEWKKDPDSYYYERLNYWFGGPVQLGHDLPGWVTFVVGGAVLAVFALSGLSWLFKFQVQQRTAELSDSEARYRLLVENQSDLLVKVDTDQTFVYVSPSFCRLFGKTEESLLGKPIAELIHEDDREFTANEVRSIAAPPHRIYLEHRALTKHGWRWVSWTGTGVLDHRGQVSEIIGLGRDITERKEAQQAFFDSNERLRLATKASQIGIWEYELVTDKLIWDDQMYVLYGLDRADFHDDFLSWEHCVHPDDVEDMRRGFQSAIEDRLPFSTEFRVVWQDQSVHHLRALAEVQYDESGIPLKVVGTNWDVTRQKRIVEALRTSEQDYRQLFENMTTGFLILKVIEDEDGRPRSYKIVQVNRAAEEMAGASRGNLAGYTMEEAFTSLEPYWSEVFAQVCISGEPMSYENMMASMGRVLSIWVFVAKPGHLGLVITDNSARRMAEDAVLRAQQQLQHVIDNTAEVIFQIDLEGNVIYCNSAIKAATGYSVEETLGMNMLQLVAPDFHELVTKRIRRRIDGRPEQGAYAFQIIHKDGHPVWIELQSNSVFDSAGRLEAIQGVARDITLRKQAERELEESRWFQREVLNMLPIAVFWKDRNLNYLGCNKTYAEDLGLEDSADIQGLDDYALHHDSPLVEGYRERDLQVIETGEPIYNYEETRTGEGGEERVLLTSKMPLRNVDGKIDGVLGLYVDITLMKQLEEVTRQTKEQLEHIVDNTKDIIFQIDLEGNYTYVNSTVTTLTGFSPEEILNMNMMELIAPEDQEMVGARMKDRAGGDPRSGIYSFRIVHKRGYRVWLELSTAGVLDADGHLVGVQGVARDVTERVEAQRQLEESRRFLRTIIDAIPARVFWKDLNSVYLGSNVSFLQDSGFESPEDLVGKTDYDLSWADTEADKYIADDQAVMECGEERINFEERQTRSDGTQLWLSSSKVPIRNAENKIIGVLGAYQDITERKHLEEERQRLSTAINQSDEAVVIMDVNGLVEYVNPAFEVITGYTRDEAVGQSLTIIQSARHEESFYDEIWQTLESGLSWRGRIFARHKDGSSYTVEAAISPVRFSFDVDNYVVTLRDVSEQIELEQHVRQAQKMDAVGRLAGGVAHDFNNILQSILGFSGILLAELEEGTAPYDDVNEIRKAARRAGDLTRQLLTLSRKQNVEYTVQSLNDTIRRNEKMMRRLIGEHIEFYFDLEGGLKPIRADISQMEQIILNLFINARDAMPDGGQLLVKTQNVHADELDGVEDHQVEGGQLVCLSVSDTGCGIRDDVRDKLFEPFFTTKRVGEGTGLGLSVVYGIVKQHSGWIEVDSEVGRGSEFKVYLPVYNATFIKEQKEKPPPDTKGTPEGSGELILVVEDDEILRELSLRLLTNAGYQVIAVANLEAALDALMRKDREFDLVLSDIVLPDGNGLDFALRARQEIPGIPVLLSSGYAQDAELFDRLKGNGFGYMEKPVGSMQLLQTVREMLEERRMI